MRRWTNGAVALCVLCAVIPAAAQNAPAETFESLAQRAQSALGTNPAEAVELYRKALALQPGWAEGWFYLGGVLYQSGRYAEATDALRKTVALAPHLGTSWAFLGLSEAELDNPEQALADIRKGEELGLGENLQFEAAVRARAAQILLESSAFDEAFSQLQPLAKRGIDLAPVIDMAGLCALAIPEKLSSLTPERRAVVRAAGTALWALARQRPEEASRAYKALIEQYPNEAGVHYAFGVYLMDVELAAAMAEFQKELDRSPNHWPALLLLSSLQIRAGDAAAAIASLQRASRMVPHKYRWLVRSELGRANMNADNLSAAINEIRAAVRLTPANAQVRYLLSQAYRRAGRKDEADKEFAEFQRLKAVQDPLGVPAFRPLTREQQGAP